MPTPKPKVIISSTDAERLEQMLDALSERDFPGKRDLENELDRAEIVDARDVPPQVVTMNSTVVFETHPGGKEFRMTLVYPQDAAKIDGNISILAPVGSALLGLSVGDEIEWPRPGGGKTRVRIKDVLYQPERSGHYAL